MSEKWEIVTKKKDKNSKLPVVKNNGNNKDVKGKKNLLNGVKIEEVLPKSQVQNLYSSNKNNKENKKPQDKTKQEKTDKKSQKKDKPQEPPKPKPPKSIQSALNAIDVDEFNSIFEKSKNHYPDAPIVWLKELVQFLNQKVPVDVQDHVFSSKPEGYPLNLVPSGLKNVIEKSVKEAGKNNTQLFFDICLTSMATDMSRGLPALGNKFYLQYISMNEPNLISVNISKHVTLRNSYQNRPNIGLSILWAVGHVGISDLHSGLTTFKELFLPLLDMKNYTRFVVKYLLDLLNRKYDESISTDEFLLILDTIYLDKKNFPVDLKEELDRKVTNLKALLFKNKEKHHAYVEVLLKKIVTNSNKPYQNCICDVLVDIFANDATTMSIWNKVYAKNVAASSVLLRRIGDNWNNISKQIDKAAVRDLLNNLKVINEELSLRKRKEDGLNDSIASIKKIEEKMVVRKSSGLSFKTISFLIILAIAGFVYLDIKQHGSWKETRTSRTLREYGVCEYSHRGMAKVKEGWAWIDTRIEENFPGYHKAVADFSLPYVQLFSDLGKVTCNAFHNVKEVFIEKYPVVLQTVESYAPGLIEQSHKAVTNVYSTSILFYNKSVDYLRKEIFVGQLSPENVQRVVIEAFNTTHQKASEYYHWIYEKVQTSIK
ncbi:transmembrane protein 214 [Anoplophora glabripennis]|uniref:transmembrane protein 214 n=1 Tax=Anoplophora glabripennis TaxID=217634 RepID=UPI0008740E7D|nr:transmembrane protein 214 [Anoplophora glabripennis]XP_018577766.1 transmembrane protein 214 [Anoplophora glabripennis]